MTRASTLHQLLYYFAEELESANLSDFLSFLEDLGKILQN